MWEVGGRSRSRSAMLQRLAETGNGEASPDFWVYARQGHLGGMLACWGYVGPWWARLGQVGPCWRGQCLGQVGALFGDVGGMWMMPKTAKQHGKIRNFLSKPTSVPRWPLLRLVAMLRLSWGPSWGHARPSWGKLGLVRAIGCHVWGHVAALLRPKTVKTR